MEQGSNLLVWEEQPFNAEPPLDLLRQEFVTPETLFYVRNHGGVPQVDPAAYRLQVQGLVREALSLSLDDIRDSFPKTTLTATLQCAGNKRIGLIEVAPIPGEVPWQAGAIGNGVWGGVLLRELLQTAGLADGAQHVAFNGLDEIEKHGEVFTFGGSIPLDVAQGDALLAYEMNGAPLRARHGFPLRVIAPGYIGARSVKWLSRITVLPQPSANYYQAHAYKLFPSNVTAETADWDRGLMLGELSINSAICRPLAGARIAESPVLVQGYAMAGGKRRVERVDVSGDGGETWATAQLVGQVQTVAWCFWEARLELKSGPCQIVCRAWDSAANTQPEEAWTVWNFKGYMNNAWHRVDVVYEPRQSFLNGGLEATAEG